MRGYTSPQVIFADDSHMDIIAEELGMDPIELRQKNAITPGYKTANGLKITSCAFSDTIDKAITKHWLAREAWEIEGRKQRSRDGMQWVYCQVLVIC